jgi:sulfur-oxidizing protein SoxX
LQGGALRIPYRLKSRHIAAGLTLVLLGTGHAWAGAAAAAPDGSLKAGKRLAMARDKGNCLACHAFDNGELPGNIGPPLFHMQQRFPDRAALRAQIWDATGRNPDTVMPPFGKHKILTDEEIDLIVDYLLSL